MADLDIKCSKCGTEVKISEFVDVKGLVCRKCGEKLRKPEAVLTTTKRTALTFRSEEKIEEQAAKDDAPPKEWQFNKTTEKKPERAAPINKHHLYSWLVFFALGGLMFFLRYRGGLSEPNLAMMKQYGPWVLLAVYYTVALLAFKDTVFQGILCFLIPLYPFYYLYMVSDSFYLRAVVLGLLIGLGQDSAVVYLEWWKGIFAYVQNFLATGGGNIR